MQYNLPKYADKNNRTIASTQLPATASWLSLPVFLLASPASPALSSPPPHLYGPPAGLVSACGGAHSQSSFSSEFIRDFILSCLLSRCCLWMCQVLHRQDQQHDGLGVNEQRRRVFYSKLHSRPSYCRLFPLPDVHSHLDFNINPRPTMHCVVAARPAGMDHNFTRNWTHHIHYWNKYMYQ